MLGPPPTFAEFDPSLGGLRQAELGPRRDAAKVDGNSRGRSCLVVGRQLPILDDILRNVGQVPGNLLVMVSPGGFEKFFEEFSQLPTDVLPEPARMQAIARKYHLEFA
jgi:hypothetical protein